MCAYIPVYIFKLQNSIIFTYSSFTSYYTVKLCIFIDLVGNISISFIILLPTILDK